MALNDYIIDFIDKNPSDDAAVREFQDALKGIEDLDQFLQLIRSITKNAEPLSEAWFVYTYQFIHYMACWEDWPEEIPSKFMAEHCLLIFPGYEGISFDDRALRHKLLTQPCFSPDSVYSRLIKLPNGQLPGLHFVMSAILGFPKVDEEQKEGMVYIMLPEALVNYLENMREDGGFEFTDLQLQWWHRLEADLIDRSSIANRIYLNSSHDDDVFLSEGREVIINSDDESDCNVRYVVVKGMINCFGIYIYTDDRRHLYAAHISPSQVGRGFFSMIGHPDFSGLAGVSYFKRLSAFLDSIPEGSRLNVVIFDKKNHSKVALERLEEMGLFQRESGHKLWLPRHSDLDQFSESEYERWSSVLDLSDGTFSLAHEAQSYDCHIEEVDIEKAAGQKLGK